jgi:hypothetical protein
VPFDFVCEGIFASAVSVCGTNNTGPIAKKFGHLEIIVTWVHVPTISVWDFQRPIGIVALSLVMLRNLGRALCCPYFLVSPWKLPCGVMYFWD